MRAERTHGQTGKFLINAANLHNGGGVQVATSFLSEVLACESQENCPDIRASSAVVSNLKSMDISQQALERRIVLHDIRGFNLFDRAAQRSMDQYKSVFTVFGPLYRWSKPFRSVVGFAQPWIIYPNNECYAGMGRLQRLKTRAKFWIQSQYFKRADILVVELDHVRDGLMRELGIPAERIAVVHNCLSSLYHDPALWETVTFAQEPADADCLRLGFLGRNYPHKNTKVFPDIAAALWRDHAIKARFMVTFTDSEWRACTPEFRAVCINVGPLTVSQCPAFYQALDGVVFPSLLECFSATPLETMAMETPLFASDRPFNREVCRAHADYFDPMQPETAAERIAAVLGPLARHRATISASEGAPPTAFTRDSALIERLQAARQHALTFSSAAERANKYLEILQGEAATPSFASYEPL